jgi:hypothetical protein
MIWIRVGNCRKYELFNELSEAVAYLNELHVGRVERWVDGGRGVGFETPNHRGGDFVNMYHGDADANLTSNLLPDERTFVEDNLYEAYS